VTVLVLTAVPAGLRGDLTKWLMELRAGVFAGTVSRRVRERLWRRVEHVFLTEGKASRGGWSALMVVTDRSREQGFTVLSAGIDRWVPEDFEGLTLMVRPAVQTTGGAPAARTASE
jgi:CRISPR-associated protein Cas2